MVWYGMVQEQVKYKALQREAEESRVEYSGVECTAM